MLRGAAILGAVGALILLGSRLQPPSRGEQYDEALATAVAPPPAPARPRVDLPDYVREPEAARQRVEALVMKSGGDINHLAPEEQRWLNALTAGHGAVMVRKRYAALSGQAHKGQGRQRE
jgi:hypothetical protein